MHSDRVGSTTQRSLNFLFNQLIFPEIIPGFGRSAKVSYRRTFALFFTGRTPFVSPNQQCQSTKQIISIHKSLYSNLSSSLCKHVQHGDLRTLQCRTVDNWPFYREGLWTADTAHDHHQLQLPLHWTAAQRHFPSVPHCLPLFLLADRVYCRHLLDSAAGIMHSNCVCSTLQVLETKTRPTATFGLCLIGLFFSDHSSLGRIPYQIHILSRKQQHQSTEGILEMITLAV